MTTPPRSTPPRASSTETTDEHKGDAHVKPASRGAKSTKEPAILVRGQRPGPRPASSASATATATATAAAQSATERPALNARGSDKQGNTEPDGDGLVRLNVYLQEQGVASRRKADTMIEQGRVQVDGAVVKKLGTRIPLGSEVRVDGKPLRQAPSTKVVFLLNKPDLCLTSRGDNQGRKTVFDLPALHRLPRNVQAVGRLDYRSEGLLLLTNDGDLAYALTHPRFSVEKSYAVLVADNVNAEDIDRLRKGVTLDDGFAKPLAVRMGNKEKLGASRGQWVEIVVTEGRNRLIRRMVETLGLKVVRLVRLAIGDLHLPEKLADGHMQPVLGAELAYLDRIKLDMLKERDGEQRGNKETPLTADDRLKRRLNRKLVLNDEEYLEERQRSSAALGARRRIRKETERDAPRSDARDAPRSTVRSDTRDAPRTARDARPSQEARPLRKPAASRATGERAPAPARGHPSSRAQILGTSGGTRRKAHSGSSVPHEKNRRRQKSEPRGKATRAACTCTQRLNERGQRPRPEKEAVTPCRCTRNKVSTKQQNVTTFAPSHSEADMSRTLVSLFTCAVLALPALGQADEALFGPRPGDTALTDEEILAAQSESDASSLETEAAYDSFICGSGVNVRGPIRAGGYVGPVIDTASYGERVALQGQSYTAWANGVKTLFVRVRFANDGYNGYVARQYVCHL